MHHFLLLSGPTDGTWRVARFAGRYGQTFRDEGLMTKFIYSYHLQIFQSFGAFLGTSVGFWQNLGVKDKASGFNVLAIEQIPGVLVGLTQNITPGLRLSGGVYYGMDRIKNFSFKDESTGEKTTMTGTARSFDWLFMVEAFYKLNHGLSITYYVRDVAFMPPQNAAGYAVDAQIRKTEDWLAAGLTYHLL